MSKCSEITCDRDVWNDLDKCILHCKKTDYQSDNQVINFLQHFYDSLVEYIIEYLQYRHEIQYHEREIRQLLSTGGLIQISPTVMTEFRKVMIHLEGIWFPEHDSRDPYDYEKLLDKFGEIHFDKCKFSTSILGIKHTKLFFQNTIFIKHWLLHNHHLLENVNGVIYQNCLFEDNVSLSFEYNDQKVIDNPIFCDCLFNKRLLHENTNFKSAIFTDGYDQLNEASEDFSIEILNCNLDDDFVLSKRKIESLIISQSNFKSEMWLTDSNVKKTTIHTSQFDKMVNCSDTTFGEFQVLNSVYRDIARFEGCNFGVENKIKTSSTNFQFVTFLSFCSFDSAIFNEGLKLNRVIFKENPTFLNLTVNPDQTDRETFRIIKNSFDKVGNYIEGNRFYKYEMLKHQEYLFNKNISSESILFSLYKITSDFGQSIIRPIFWLVITALIYWFLIIIKNVDILFKLLPESTGAFLHDFMLILNSMTKYIIPYQSWLEPGLEFLSLIFYIIFTSLIWLVILAIKRKTRR